MGVWTSGIVSLIGGATPANNLIRPTATHP